MCSVAPSVELQQPKVKLRLNAPNMGLTIDYSDMYVCMYVYFTYYAPICRANGMKKASFARIVGAGINYYMHVSHYYMCIITLILYIIIN